MMKYLYFLMFVAISHAYVSGERWEDDSQAFESRESDYQDRRTFDSRDRDDQNSKNYESREKDEQDIPAPRLNHLTLVEDSQAIKVEWTRVEAPQGEAPVQGYKVKVWEQNEDDRSTEKSSNNDRKLRDVVVNGQEKTSAVVRDIEHGVTYKVRVQAYNRNGDGPLSQSMSIKVAPKEDNYNNRAYYA